MAVSKSQILDVFEKWIPVLERLAPLIFRRTKPKLRVVLALIALGGTIMSGPMWWLPVLEALFQEYTDLRLPPLATDPLAMILGFMIVLLAVIVWFWPELEARRALQREDDECLRREENIRQLARETLRRATNDVGGPTGFMKLLKHGTEGPNGMQAMFIATADLAEEFDTGGRNTLEAAAKEEAEALDEALSQLVQCLVVDGRVVEKPGQDIFDARTKVVERFETLRHAVCDTDNASEVTR